jgi:DNA-binding MarR family transcriptional regulator
MTKTALKTPSPADRSGTDDAATSATDRGAFADDLGRISDTLGRLRMLIGRRIIARTAIANTVPGLELSHLDVLEAMRRTGGEVTVGAIADAMRIDPSRGSRLVAELVGRGVLRRDASQEDGRRSIIARTALGDKLLDEMRSVKHSLLQQVLEDWDEHELQAFSHMFERFVSGFEDAALTTVRMSDIEANADR